jgi:hypothetical protein
MSVKMTTCKVAHRLTAESVLAWLIEKRKKKKVVQKKKVDFL